MLRVEAVSKKGRKQITRHGNKWMPVAAERQVGCLGGVPGIQLMSIQDKATFWIKVEGDENLLVAERLDNFGRPVQDGGKAVLNVDFTKDEKPVLPIYKLKGTTSGRSSAGGGGEQHPNDPGADTGSSLAQAEVTLSAP